jgi:P-type Ca2+ transporter type 2C
MAGQAVMSDEAVSVVTGLSETEAASRLEADGPNQWPRPKHRSLARMVLEILREPMFALLLDAGGVYLALGDIGEGITLLVFAQLSAVIAVVQESRSERVLEALHDLASPRALVMRGGMRRRIAGREVVRGDVLVLAEGDRVAADAVLRISRGLHTDESLLTGEALPVRKTATASTPAPGRPGGEDLPFVFSGTMVVRGQGIAEVFATGARSEIGKIRLARSTIQSEPSPLQVEMRPWFMRCFLPACR